VGGYTSQAGFGQTSQSFPPITASVSIGNGSANNSFGGFGNDGSLFNFSTGGGITNPFAAQQNAQPATNGVSNGGVFNFGGGQQQSNTPPAFGGFGSQPQPPQQSSQNIFGTSLSQSKDFGGAFSTPQQQPTTNIFGAATSQPTPSLFAASTPQPSQSLTGGFGGFGSGPPAQATTAPSMFAGFGATAGQTSQATFGGLGQSTTQQAPSFEGYGQSTPAPAFGQPNGEMMKTTPEPSPQKTLGWNKQTMNGTRSSVQDSGESSPDRPPHIEQDSDINPPNVFANIARPSPQPTPTPQPTSTPVTSAGTEVSSNLFNFSKPAELEPQREPEKPQEKENVQPNSFAVATPTPATSSNPFASLKWMPQSEQPSLFSASLQAEKPKVPSISSVPPKITYEGLFGPPSGTSEKTTEIPPGLFNFGNKPAQQTVESAPMRGSSPPKTTTPSSNGASKIANGMFSQPKAQNMTQSFQAPISAPTSTRTANVLVSPLYARILPELLREDNLPAPDTQRDLNEEETRFYYQALKVDRLNILIMKLFAKFPKNADLSSVCIDYINWMDEIKKDVKGNRLAELIEEYGELAGQKRYDQEQGRIPMAGTNKRRAAPPEEQESEKRAKTNGDAPQSSTASKFQSLFEQPNNDDEDIGEDTPRAHAQNWSAARARTAVNGPDNSTPAPSNSTSAIEYPNIFGASTSTPAPPQTSNLFHKAAPSLAPASTSNLFNRAASPAEPATNNLFGNSATAPAVTPGPSNAVGLFSQEVAAPAASPAPVFGGGFRPSTSLISTEVTGQPAFSSFTPSTSLSTSQASKAPAFFGFTPSTSSSTAEAPKAPPLTGFTPSASLSTSEAPKAPVFTGSKPSTSLSTSEVPKAPAFTGFKPSTSLSTTDAQKTPAFSGFKPVNSTASSSFSLPKFGSGSGNFLNQFAQNAEETAKKAKKLAMEEDYDSDEETKEQWEARYEKQQEEKRKKLAATAVAASGFKFTPTSSVAGSNAGSGDEGGSRGTGFLALPPAPGSTFSNFSRSVSPANALSPGGSVFDAPRSGTPVNKDNPFANISQQASERGDADDEEEEEEEDSVDGDERSLAGGEVAEDDVDQESTPKVNGVTARQGPFMLDGASDESSSEKLGTPKPRTDGLFGRVSRDSPVDRTPLATTGANTSSILGTSGPTVSVWTPKDPIKFSTGNGNAEAEKSTTKPAFSFTPVGASSKSSQPVFSGLFSNMQGSPAASGTTTPSNPFANLITPSQKTVLCNSLWPPSGATSVFNTPGPLSRATTPGVSDMSGAESTANEAEEPKPDNQIDIADLAKDKEGCDVIFESSKVKATKYDKGDKQVDSTAGEAAKEGWHVAGVGPIAILKHQESGIVSMLMRTTPSGRVIINTRITGVLNPQAMNKRARLVIVTKDGAESYLIGFQTTDDCKAFVDAIKANGAK
jgi:hypothetical protein